MANLKLNRFAEAERDCTASLSHEAGNIKVLLRRATARKALEKYDAAISDVDKIIWKESSNKTAIQLKKDLLECKAKQAQAAIQKAEITRKYKADLQVNTDIIRPRDVPSKPRNKVLIEEVDEDDDQDQEQEEIVFASTAGAGQVVPISVSTSDTTTESKSSDSTDSSSASTNSSSKTFNSVNNSQTVATKAATVSKVVIEDAPVSNTISSNAKASAANVGGVNTDASKGTSSSTTSTSTTNTTNTTIACTSASVFSSTPSSSPSKVPASPTSSNPSLPGIPKTFIEMDRICRSYNTNNDINVLSKYLLQIPVIKLKKLLTNAGAFESDLLVILVKGLHTAVTNAPDTDASFVLKSFATIIACDKFSNLVMFLSSKEKSELTQYFTSMLASSVFSASDVAQFKSIAQSFGVKL
jgi:hypothetical protein